MIKLRLKRYGKKREASYRIVAMNSRDRRDGRPIEELGFYNPRTDETRLNADAILRRLQQGAQPTQTVRDILRKANLLGGGAATAVVTPDAPPAPETPAPESAVDDVAESVDVAAESAEEIAAAEAETVASADAEVPDEEPASAEVPQDTASNDAAEEDTASESEQPATA